MEYKNKKLEELKKFLKNKKIAILGIGVSNTPLIDYLYNIHAEITVFDKREMQEIDQDLMDKLIKRKIEISCGKDYLSNLIGFDVIFRSPGIRPDIPELKKEVERGAVLTSEIELVVELCPGKVIGITGSDGKTTTTSLIYEILKQAGYTCYLGGNIGIPLFTKIDEIKPEDIVVLELSSFQLMPMKVSPQIAVITNITPNHLDIHKSYEEYIEAKKAIYKYQDEDGIVVLNYENEITKNFEKEINGQVKYFSKEPNINCGFMLDGDYIVKGDTKEKVLYVKDVKLRGRHNYENICTALTATETLVELEEAIKTIKEFTGVEHRIEYVKEINGAKWYNDSIGSSPTRTIAGLNSFDENIILIAGGYDKHLDYTPIGKPIVQKVGTLVLLGATAAKIEEAVKQTPGNEKVKIKKCQTLEEAVKQAKEASKPGDVVLFSPASASFDMFKNFMERGEKFKKLVNLL